MTNIYARVVDGAVVEYPVSELHIRNRHEPLSKYTPVVFDQRPPENELYWLREIVTPGDPVRVSYERVAHYPPPVVSMRQARLALLGAGLLAQVDAAIASMPGVEGEAARIEWEYATEVRRDSALVSAIGRLLGLDDAALDELFAQAAKL